MMANVHIEDVVGNICHGFDHLDPHRVNKVHQEYHSQGSSDLQKNETREYRSKESTDANN